MKYQLIAIGTTGDVAPMTALGRELVKRGEKVNLAAFDDYRQMAEKAGLGFTPLPGDLKRFIEKLAASGSNPITYIRNLDSFISPIVPKLLGAIYRAMSDCDVVVFTFFGTFMYSMAKSLGKKCFEVNFIPLADNREMPLPIFPKAPLSSVFNPLSHYIANLVISMFETYYASDAMTSMNVKFPKAYLDGNRLARKNGVTVLCAFSQSLIQRPREWGDNVYMTGFWDIGSDEDEKTDKELTDFVSKRDDIIYAGFGSMRSKGMNELFDMLLFAAKELGKPLIAYTGGNDLNIKAGDDIFVIDSFVSHDRLFKNVSYAIHHGGAGTTASALRAGLPSFIVPFFGDQPFWADVISREHLGPEPVRFGKITYENVYEGMKRLVTANEYKLNARNISLKLQGENGVSRACDIITGTRQ